MKRLHPAALALGLSLVLAACQQQESAPTAAKPAAPAAARAAAPATAPAAAPAAPSATAEAIGVAECDDYIAKYQACMQSKVPEGQRASLAQALDQMRTAWRSTAATPGGKEALATACKQAHDSARAAMGAYGCTDI